MQRPTSRAAGTERAAEASNLEGSRVNGGSVNGRDGVVDASRGKIGSLTVLVPTRNESPNIAPLLDRLGEISRTMPLSVLFVDDSTDATPELIRRLAARSTFPVDVLHRPASDRTNGLGGAVRAGLKATRSELVCVMDADLQHPPEILPELVAESERSTADVVVASRHGAGGDLATFSAGRRALSRVSALVARALFPFRLRGLSDPMSGFFLVRRVTIDVTALRPNGFKILLEILLSGPRLTISEVGFRFGERQAGHSKATLREGGRYLRRLITLRLSGWNPAGKRGITVAAPMPIRSFDADATS